VNVKCKRSKEISYIKLLNLGIGSHYRVNNIGSIGPRVFRSNRVRSSGVGGIGALRLHPTNSYSLSSKRKPAVGRSMV